MEPTSSKKDATTGVVNDARHTGYKPTNGQAAGGLECNEIPDMYGGYNRNEPSTPSANNTVRERRAR